MASEQEIPVGFGLTPSGRLARDGLLILTSFFLVVGALLGGVKLELLPDPETTKAAAVIYGPLLTGLVALGYWLGLRVFNDPMPAVSTRPPLSQLKTLRVAALYLLTALAVSVLLTNVLDWLGFEVQEQESITELVRQGDMWTLSALGIGALLLAPLAEEWLFRRLLFTRIKCLSGRLPAYVVTSLLFGAIHGNLTGLVVYVWLGLVFARAYEVTGKLSAAILVHMGNNIFAFTLLLLTPPASSP